MDNESIVEQFVDNLSFEIETATQNNPVRLKNRLKSTPLNVKVRVRKKNEAPHYGVVSVPKIYTGTEKIHFANSDQTIMSFDLFMEPDLQNRPTKKYRRKLIKMIRQATCLSTQKNDEDLCYLPSSSYKQTLKEQSVSSNSDCLLKQSTALVKRNYLGSLSSLSKSNYFLGKCKPGGCLDPPFNEDKYPYAPKGEKLFIPTRKPMNISSNVGKHDNRLIKIIENNDSSHLGEHGVNKQKDTNAIIKLYEAATANTSLSTTHSNSIITYPPILTSSEYHIKNEKNMHINVITEVNKDAIDDRCSSYFIPPKIILKQLEKKKSEMTNLLFEKENISNVNIQNNEILDKANMRNSTRLSQPTYFDTKLKADHTNSETESLNKNETCDKNTIKEIFYKQSEINEAQNSVPIVLNENFATQEDNNHENESILLSDINIRNGIYKSYDTNKLIMKNVDLCEQNVQEILKPSNHNISSTFKYLNAEILSDSNNSVSMIITEENIGTSEKTLKNNKIIGKILDESTQNVSKPLSNDQNIGQFESIAELYFDNQPANDTSHNDSISFTWKSKVFYGQNFPTASLDSNKIINPNYQNCDSISTSYQYTESKQNCEKNILTISEKVEDVTTSDRRIYDFELDEKNNILPRSIDTTNLCLNNETKILANHSSSSINKSLVETIPSISHTGHISVKKSIDSAVSQSNLNGNDSVKQHYVLDDQVVQHCSKLSVNKEKERSLQDDSTMDTLKVSQRDNITCEILVNVSSTEKSDIELLHGKLRTSELKYNSLDSPVLVDIMSQSSIHNQSFFGEKDFNTGSEFDVRNVKNNNSDIFLNVVPGKDEILSQNSLSTSNLQLISHSDNFALPSIYLHEMTNDDTYKQTPSNKAMPRSFVIENLPDNKLDVTNSIGPKDLQVLDAHNQDEYPDAINVNIPVLDLINVSHISLNRSINVLNVNDKNDEFSVDLAFQIYTNNKNQRFLRSFSVENEPERYSNDTVLKLKSEIRTSNCKIKIPIDTKKNLRISIDKLNDHIELPRSTMNKGMQISEEIKAPHNTNPSKTNDELGNSYLLSICEKELMPLQMAIKDLKKEIDSFAEQQSMLKNNLYSLKKKTTLIRFSNVGKRCGCFKDYF